MTLTDINRLCLAPEGMEWREDPDCDGGFILTRVGEEFFTPDGGAVYIRHLMGLDASRRQVCAECGDDVITIYTAEVDLPSTYLRALAAVGLAEDPEKVALRKEVAELRQRLAWSEDVPTSEGLVLVWHPGDDEPEMWRTLDTADGLQWEHHNYVGHGNPFPPGTRFFPLANLKEPR